MDCRALATIVAADLGRGARRNDMLRAVRQYVMDARPTARAYPHHPLPAKVQYLVRQVAERAEAERA